MVSFREEAGYLILENDEIIVQLTSPFNDYGTYVPILFAPIFVYTKRFGSPFVVSSGCYSFLKLAFRDYRYNCGIYIHANKNKASQLVRWKNIDRIYTTINGRSAITLRGYYEVTHPVSLSNFPMGLRVSGYVEWTLADGENFIRRYDFVETNQPVFDAQMEHNCEVQYPSFATGYTKTYISDCETKDFVYPAGGGIALNSDRMVGYNSLKFTYLSGGKGKRFYKEINSEDWTDSDFIAFWLRPRDSDVFDAIRFFIEDANAGLQYIGNPVSLIKEYVLSDDKTTHEYKGKWRQVFIDISGVERGEVTKFGFEILVDDLIDFLLDDIHRYSYQRYSLENARKDYFPVIVPPATYRDFRAFPDYDSDKLINFDHISYLPFFIHHIGLYYTTGVARTHGRLTKSDFYDRRRHEIDGFFNGKQIEWRSGANNDGKTTVIRYDALTKHFEVEKTDNDIWDTDPYLFEEYVPAGNVLSFAACCKTKYSAQCGLISGQAPDGSWYNTVSTRMVARFLDLEACQMSFESIFVVSVAPSERECVDNIVSIWQQWDRPECENKTSADLPDVSNIRKLVQANPKDRYITREWLYELFSRLKEVKCGYVAAGMTPGVVFYKHPKAWLLNTPWDNVMTDSKIDFIQLYSDVIKKYLGLPLVVESTAAVPEGEREIPFYNRKHVAVLEDGSLYMLRFWLYYSDDGYFVLRESKIDEFPDEYYNPIELDGKRYYLQYTYTLTGTCLASAYGHKGEFGLNEKTICDMRLEQIEYVVNNYDIDCITLSEDCTFYHHGSYGEYDFNSYNYWRENIKGLPPVDNWPVPDPSKPIGPDNQVEIDDPLLWEWKCWLIERFIQEVVNICHNKGVLVMVDFNLESTIPTKNRYHSVYNQDNYYWIQDERGRWYTRQYDLWGARYGTHIKNVLKIADLGYLWNYGNFNPWGFFQCYMDYLDFINDKGYQGRLLFGPGLYPDFNPPKGSELLAAIIESAKYGFGCVVPTTRQFGSFKEDYLHYIDLAYQTIPDVVFKDLDTLDAKFNIGFYFIKARNIRFDTGGRKSTVYIYDKNGNLTNTIADYDGSGTISVPANSNVYVETGNFKPYVDRKLEYKRTKGLGMLADVIEELCRMAGLSSDDIDTSELSLVPVYGVVVGNEAPIETIKKLQEIYDFDIIESEGKLKFRLRGGKSPVATIRAEELLPNGDSNYKREFRARLPQVTEVAVRFIDYDRNYATSVQKVSTRKQPKNAITIDADFALNPETAKEAAERKLLQMLNELSIFTFVLPPKYLFVEPGDVIKLVDGDQSFEILVTETIKRKDNCQECIGIDYFPEVYSTATKPTSPPLPDNTFTEVSSTSITFISPPLLPWFSDELGIFFAVKRDNPDKKWDGVSFYVSLDDGVSFHYVGSLRAYSVVGVTDNTLSPAKSTVIDRKNELIVTLYEGELSSISDDAFFGYGNLAIVNGEVIQFRDVELVGPKQYKISHLLRGLYGTEDQIGQHSVGDPFVLLSPNSTFFYPLPLDFIEKEIIVKVVTFGENIEDAITYRIKPPIRHLQPLSPVHVNAFKKSNGDIVISWIRRTRVGGEWKAYADVPLGEEKELYDIQIFSGSSVVRYWYDWEDTTVVYTADEQLADFGVLQDSITVRIYQKSTRVWRGIGTKVTLEAKRR